MAVEQRVARRKVVAIVRQLVAGSMRGKEEASASVLITIGKTKTSSTASGVRPILQSHTPTFVLAGVTRSVSTTPWRPKRVIERSGRGSAAPLAPAAPCTSFSVLGV